MKCNTVKCKEYKECSVKTNDHELVANNRGNVSIWITQRDMGIYSGSRNYINISSAKEAKAIADSIYDILDTL